MNKEKQEVEFKMRVTKSGNTLINLLFDTNVAKLANIVLRYFANDTYFTSNTYTRRKICEEMKVSEDIYYRALNTLTNKNLILKIAKGYYMLNHNLLELIKK